MNCDICGYSICQCQQHTAPLADKPKSQALYFPNQSALAIAKAIKKGITGDGLSNWRSISRTEHLNYALAHIFLHFAGDDQEDHMVLAATRIMFALETKDP